MSERSDGSSQGTNEPSGSRYLSFVAIIRAKSGLGLRTSTCHSSRPARVEPGNIGYAPDRSNDDVCILYEYWNARPDLVAHFELPHIKAFPKVLPEVLESEMDLWHWFDHYEDRKRN